jgi:SP family arabinose:H+ symporter-like MFS transporter
MMVLQFFVVLFFYPETKGVSLEEMQRKLGIA